TDAVATKCPIPSGINGADIAGFEGDMMNVVEFYEMLVAVKENRAMRVIVDDVVRDAMADAVHQDCRNVAFGPASLLLKMTVLDGCSPRFGLLGNPRHLDAPRRHLYFPHRN